LSTESNHAPSLCKEIRRIKPARTNARTCTARTCTATSATFRYDRILVSLTHPTDNQAPELEALVQAIAGIEKSDNPRSYPALIPLSPRHNTFSA